MSSVVPPHEASSTVCFDVQPGGREPSQREAWAERRRIMEAQKLQFGPDGVRSLWHSRVFAVALAMFHSGIQLVGLDKRGRRNALDVQLTTRFFFLPDLPRAFDGYRILHLSDTHLDCLPDLAMVTARLLAGVEVDLLVLTGDVHGNHRAPLAASTAPLADLIRAVRVKDRRLAVLGNHDPAGMAAELDQLGFEVLINQSTVLLRKGEQVVVTGLDDVNRFYTPEALRALSEAAAGFPASSPGSLHSASRAGSA